MSPKRAAANCDLRHVCDRQPGIARRRRGRGFEYRDARGRPVSAEQRARITSLVIPPAWDRVWICADPRGHLQATGYDARGRKQYRYHNDWTIVRNAAKFGELAGFGQVLPRLRRRVRKDLALPDMSREQVLACIIWMLDHAHIRIGNDEYARENGSFGLTTIRNEHASVRGDTIRLRFRGKSGVACNTTFRSARAARIVRGCQDLPGQELFCYVDDEGQTHDVGSGDVNSYLRQITGQPITSKHFRTWGGSVAAAEALRAMGFVRNGANPQEFNRREVAAIDAAASRLCNTRAVCRKFYVHPVVLEADRDGRFERAFAKSRQESVRGLAASERALLTLLGGHLRVGSRR